MLGNVLGCPIEAGVVRPLVDDAEIAVKGRQGGDAVFCKDGQAQAVDQFRYAVVDFRVDVVRATAKNDGPLVVLFEVI